MVGAMITLLRSSGLQFAMYVVDHDPPHVHVYGDGFAKITLRGRNGRPMISESRGMKDNDLKRALRIVEEHQEDFLIRWRAMHG